MDEMNANAPRYGIYFAPEPGARLHCIGSRWLGRDASSCELLDPNLPEGIGHDEWLRATEGPRRYGLHATLKPPFRLATGVTIEDLHAALREFASRNHCFEAPPLQVAALGRFLALTLSEQSEKFSSLAAGCVSEFDRFRAPATEQELEHRLRDSLSAREREHVLLWGYPYVFDTWKFHISITGSLPQQSLPPLEQSLRRHFAPVCGQPLPVGSVCIFREPSPGAPFCIVDRVPLRSL
jgi:putative phosphonate metabolism protein